MKKTRVTLKNDFHDTEVNLIVEFGKILTPAQKRRSFRELCGVFECECSGGIGIRGRQDYIICGDGEEYWLAGKKEEEEELSQRDEDFRII